MGWYLRPSYSRTEAVEALVHKTEALVHKTEAVEALVHKTECPETVPRVGQAGWGQAAETGAHAVHRGPQGL